VVIAFYKRPESDFLEKIRFWNFLFADGHTEKQMIPRLKYQDKTIVLR
jgi:hypothetical protein